MPCQEFHLIKLFLVKDFFLTSPLTHSLSPSLTLFTPSLSSSLTHSLPPSLTLSLPHSLPPSLTHSLTPSLPQSLPPSLTPSLPPPPPLPPSLTPPSLTPSLTHPSLPQEDSLREVVWLFFQPSHTPEDWLEFLVSVHTYHSTKLLKRLVE